MPSTSRPARGSTSSCRATGSARECRLHHQDREVGAVRDPVGPALDHRHHRHPVGPRPRPPGGLAGRHRLRARPRQHAAADAARPRRRRGRVRRAAAPARGASRADLEDLPRAHRRGAGARPGDDRRRQADDLPGDGPGRRRRRRDAALDGRGPARASPTGCRCSAPAASRPAPTSGSRSPRSSGLDVGRHRPPARPVRRPDRRGARPDRAAVPSWPSRSPGAEDYLLRRGRLRGHPRGCPPPRRRAHPTYPHLDRDLRPRHRFGPARPPS